MGDSHRELWNDPVRYLLPNLCKVLVEDDEAPVRTFVLSTGHVEAHARDWWHPLGLSCHFALRLKKDARLRASQRRPPAAASRTSGGAWQVQGEHVSVGASGVLS